MNVAEMKVEMIGILTQIASEDKITRFYEKLYEVMEAPEDDWWDDLSPFQQTELVRSLEENASLSAAQKFASNVDAKLERLKEHPFIGRPSTKAKTVRKIIVSKNIQMMYRVVGKTLVISNFFNTRQDPNKSRF
jgi:plasmid stabilization system protein ParE